MRSALFACAVALACAPAPSVTASPTTSTAAAPPVPTAAGIGGVSTRTAALRSGLSIDIPSSWTVAGEALVNKATDRELIASNVDVASLPLFRGNGDVDTAALAPGRFVLEIESFCSLSCQGPTAETDLPIDWTKAVDMAAGQAFPAGRHQLGVAARWFDHPFFVVARWADPAAAELALMPAIVRSLRPTTPPPARGEYLGWDGVAALSDVPVGSVRWEPLPQGAVVQQPLRAYDAAPFFLVRGKQGIYAFVALPLNDTRCVIYYDPSADRFRCGIEARMYEWTRFGRYLGPEPLSDLTQHRVIVRDGIVWVGYTRDTLNSPPVPDEAAEY